MCIWSLILMGMKIIIIILIIIIIVFFENLSRKLKFH